MSAAAVVSATGPGAAHGIPMSTFYNRISYFRKKAHLIPDAAPRVAEPRQQVLALSVADENPNSRMAEPSHIKGPDARTKEGTAPGKGNA